MLTPPSPVIEETTGRRQKSSANSHCTISKCGMLLISITVHRLARSPLSVCFEVFEYRLVYRGRLFSRRLIEVVKSKQEFNSTRKILSTAGEPARHAF